MAKRKLVALDAVVSMQHNAFKGTWGAANGVETYVDKKPTTADLRLAGGNKKEKMVCDQSEQGAGSLDRRWIHG